MKQNSRILFHHMRKPLRKSYFGNLVLSIISIVPVFLASMAVAGPEKPEYLPSFDPAKGFKTAQSDLTEVFLQIAGSLEFYGSPEPYLRHMKAEHARIEAKYQQRFGRASKAYWPVYMNDAYFDQFAENWNALAPKFGLVAIAKNTGNGMRDAILGTRGNGTMLVEILNQHQANVLNAMTGKSTERANFDALKAELVARLELGKTVIHDQHYAIMQRDAVDFTIGIRGPINELFASLDARLSHTDSAQFRAAVTSIFIDVGRLAQAELEAAIVETALDRQPDPKQVNVR